MHQKLFLVALLLVACRCGGKPKLASKPVALTYNTTNGSLGTVTTKGGSGVINSFSKRSGSIKRYFLIGYIADSPDGLHIFDGGVDTSMDHYPNINELDNWLAARFHISKIRIIGITEQSESDYKAFWKGFNKQQ